jgi:hypothetical protein
MLVKEWDLNVSYTKGDIICIESNNNPEYYICAIDHVSDNLINPQNPEEIYWIHLKDFSEEGAPFLLAPTNENVPLAPTSANFPDIGPSGIIFTSEHNDIENLIKSLMGSVPVLSPVPMSRTGASRKKEPELTQEEIESRKKEQKLKRKISNIDNDLETFKKKRRMAESELAIEDQIKLLNVDMETKLFLLDKHSSLERSHGSDYSKGKTWLKTVLNIPFGKYKSFPVKKDDPPEKINEYFKKVRGHLDAKVHNMDYVKDEIMEYLARKITNPRSKGHVLALAGAPGVGKCFSKDTPVLMFDGSIKMVQDIEIGEMLMGDDSTPRTVLTLGNGRDTMYKITNVKGENYTVNSEHILCLKYSKNKNISDDKKFKRFKVKWFNNKDVKINVKNFNYNNKEKNTVLEEAKEYLNNLKEEKICEISVKKYLQLSQSIKDKLKGYSVPINFIEKELEFDPYIIGLWLGDGDKRTSGISCQDSTILKYLSSTLPKYKCYLQYTGDQYDYRINGLKNEGRNSGGNNKMLNILKQFNMINNKHIPMIYKCNSKENRLKLLAGLIDSDGSLNHHKSGYEFSQSLEHEQIIDDIVYLARSLGFACYKNKKQTTWTYKGIKKQGEAWRICISGEGIEKIPVLCPRKKANSRQQIKDVLVSGIKVEELPEDNYYGFMIDGNERFVLGNFIVTHNTRLLKTLGEALDLPFYQVNFGGINDASILTGHSETYVGSKPGKFVEFLQNSGCINPIMYFDEIDKIASNKEQEINGILTHLLDEEQNSKFQDNYLSNVPIDLSKVFFVIAFNDFEKVDRIVSDRLKVIYITSPTMDDKMNIAKDKMIPDIIESFNFKKDKYINLDDTVLSYIINNKVPKEEGVRQLRKSLEKIFSKLNYYILTGEYQEKTDYFKVTMEYEDNVCKNVINIKRNFIDKCLESKEENMSHIMMYV